MRTLKYAILGLLNQKAMSGYDLTQEFESTLNEFWYAKHSQIYPELKRLTEEGLVTYQIEISGTVLEKKIYSITETGKTDFLTWLSQPVEIGPTPKDTFRLKVFFSTDLNKTERIRQLQDQVEKHKNRLEHLKGNQQKFPSIPDKETAAFGDYLVLMGAVMREEMTCEWLEKCIQLTEQ